MRNRPCCVSLLALMGLLLGACEMNLEPRKDSSYEVDIRWTSHGIPHVKAEDWGSLGYGFAYATAVDGVCVIARDVLRVNGELSKHFGSGEGNFESDVFHKALLDHARVEAFNEAQSERTQAFSDGYADGYNRYLRDKRDELPGACKEAPWVEEIDAGDVTRVTIGVGIRYGLARFDRAIAAATPAQEIAVESLAANTGLPEWPGASGIGSNGVAIGSDLSASGRGILLGNPHYPWEGPSRFHMIHLTIPGELDVMGASLLNTSRVGIGFNRDVAWTHTVSTALRFTLYELELHPEDPMRYRYDDEYREIESRTVEVLVAAQDDVETRSHTIYLSHYGPILQSGSLAWADGRAYAVRDAVIDNYLTAETYDALSMARSTADIEAAISRQGIYWVNTIAADRYGNAFYADISAAPNVDAQLLEECGVGEESAAWGPVILDGSRSECEWRESERSEVPGVLPPDEMPRITRTDYVTNSNDSYWLSNPAAPLEGYSPIIGPERTARSLRTRAGLRMVSEFIERGGQVTPADVQGMLYAHRNYSAELVLDDVLRACAGEADLANACEVLAAWNRTQQVQARGGHLWREFWNLVSDTPDLWAVPFDLADPVNTPRGLNIEDAVVREAVLTALRSAVDQFAAAEIPLDARLGDIQYATRNGRRIPVPGGDGDTGMFSMIVTELNGQAGYTPITHGNSYIQVISWDEEGQLDPRAILTYSQSPEPDSPYYSDQTEIYAEGGWIKLPFAEWEILAAPVKRQLHLADTTLAGRREMVETLTTYKAKNDEKETLAISRVD